MIKSKDPFAGLDPAWGILPRPEACLHIVGAFDLTNGLEAACVNHAGGPPARIIGSPTVGANYIRGSLGNCIETEIFDRSEICIVTVSRMPFAPVNGAIVVGTYRNSTDDGTSLYYNSGGELRFSANTTGALNTSSFNSAATFADWWISIVSAVQEDAPILRTVVNQRTYDDALEASNLNPVNNARDPAGRKFRIGDDYSASFGDPVDVAAAFFVAGLGGYDAPTLAIKDAFAADVAAWCGLKSLSLG